MRGVPALQPGDIFFTASDSWLGRAIRWATRSKGEAKTKVNHVGMITSHGPAREVQCIEALWHVKCHSFWDAYHGKKTLVAIFRPLNETDTDRHAQVVEAAKYCGRRYAWWRLPVYLAEKITGEKKYSKYLFLTSRNTCMNLVGVIKATIGKYFGRRAQELTPDDGWDFCHSSEHYQCIYELKQLG